MPVKVVVSDPFLRTKKTLEEIDLNGSLGAFKETVSKGFGVDVIEQELLFLGEILQDDSKSLESYGIQNNTTVYLLKKLSEDGDVKGSELPVQTIDEVNALLSKAKNPAFKQMLKKLFQNKEAIEKIINENEVLKNDLTLSALLRDPDLSLPILESLSAETILEDHPKMGYALKIVLSSISMTDSIGRQALLQGVAEEDGDYEGVDPALLAQAELMAANEESIQQHQRQPGSQQQSSSSQQNRQISASDLANALSFASVTPAAPAVSMANPSTEQPDYADALAQMRATGVTDELQSRRALAMSGGNVEMALNLIFEGALD